MLYPLLAKAEVLTGFLEPIHGLLLYTGLPSRVTMVISMISCPSNLGRWDIHPTAVLPIVDPSRIPVHLRTWSGSLTVLLTSISTDYLDSPSYVN